MHSPHTPASANDLKVLVVDDDKNFVDTLVEQFQRRGISATGVSDPTELQRWTKAEAFLAFHMIFLDMRLGVSKSGKAISAADILLHMMTYSPKAKAVVFTQKDITVEEIARCIQLGARGFIPKLSDIDHFILVAEVFQSAGDEEKALQERLRSLWDMLEDGSDPAKGRHLEMFTTNLFNSIPGFTAVAHNTTILAGEIDLVVQNACENQFWKVLDSLHLVIECKNQHGKSEKEVFNALTARVKDKKWCKVGILVSWESVTSGFWHLQTAGKDDDITIFVLNRSHLLELVKLKASEREAYLRSALEVQL